MINEVVIKSSKSFSIFPSIGLTAIVVIFFYQEKEKLFDWKQFNPNGITTIVFIMFLSFVIICWILYFDNKPLYKITEEGIWHRSNIFKRELNSLVKWDNIDYFFIEAVNQKGTTSENLVIKLKNKEKYLKLMLTGLDIVKEDLLQIIERKAKELNIHNLGFENSDYSKY